MECSLYIEQKTNKSHQASEHAKGLIKMEELQDCFMG